MISNSKTESAATTNIWKAPNGGGDILDRLGQVSKRMLFPKNDNDFE